MEARLSPLPRITRRTLLARIAGSRMHPAFGSIMCAECEVSVRIPDADGREVDYASCLLAELDRKNRQAQSGVVSMISGKWYAGCRRLNGTIL